MTKLGQVRPSIQDLFSFNKMICLMTVNFSLLECKTCNYKSITKISAIYLYLERHITF